MLRTLRALKSPFLVGAGLSATAGCGAASVFTSPAAAAAPQKPINAMLSDINEKLTRMEAVAISTSAAGVPASCSSEDAIAKARLVGRRTAFPMVEPYNTGYFSVPTGTVGITHEIYYEECGNPNGKPVVIVHGGPGGGCAEYNRTFHDPAAYRIILFDQRGCGRSKPHAELTENTTWHLVDDIERLRKLLKINKWQVFGGSWGSCLGLTYAESHPEAVTELVLRGIFMLRKSELAFYYQDGASHIYPDTWEEYRDAIPIEERGDFMQAYRKRLIGTDPVEQIKAARAWTKWENRTSNLIPPAGEVAGDEDQFALAFARIENHYFVHGGFFEWETWILDNVDKIRHIPCCIVQGRYDVVCPAKSAWDLHRAWPEADLHIVQDSGHSALEPGNFSKLVEFTEQFKNLPY